MDHANLESGEADAAGARGAPSGDPVAEQVELAPISFVLGLVAAAAIGGVLGWQTRRHVLWSAMRQVFVVSLASGVTFLVCWLLGTAAS